MLYGTTPDLQVFALDAATGAELWRFDPASRGRRGFNPNRGVTWWADAATDDERIFASAGPHLWALDARTGAPIDAFGDAGRVDLRVGLRDEPVDADVVATTPGALFEDLLLLGTRVSELRDAAPGHVRAFDVRTGAIRWTFHTIPRPGEAGHETWPEDAWQRVGGANAWAGIAVDRERGLAFVPTGSAAFDFYGGDRAGDNLFANSLVALDARTGERRWHFQVVHHDVWDRDLPAPPNLLTLTRPGGAVDAVAQVTKHGYVYTFDRVTGEPVFPIDELPVPADGLPGEPLSPTQPVPRAPPPFTRQRFEPTDRSPALRRAVEEATAGLRQDGLFAPPSRQGTIVMPGFDGGAEWGGAAVDPRTGWLYVNANERPNVLRMLEPPVMRGPGSIGRTAYLLTCAGCHGLEREGDGLGTPPLRGVFDRLGVNDVWDVVRHGRGRMPGNAILRAHELALLLWYLRFPGEPAAQEGGAAEAGDDGERGFEERLFPRFMNAGWESLRDPEGMPAVKPPWGTLTAYDLAAGRIAWQVPLGRMPQLGDDAGATGAPNYGGPALTAGGLLFIAATPDETLRAFDAATGALLWQAPLPASGFATPTVYEAGGRQFVVIAAGGGKLGRPSGGRYVAFALPRGVPVSTR